MTTETHAMQVLDAQNLATGVWRLDPSRSSVEFHVGAFFRLVTVKGRFDRYEGSLTLSSRPAVALVTEAGSLNTENTRRDTHLRSADFFDVADHPRVRFEADAADLDGSKLRARGVLYAAGKHVPLDVEATVTAVGEEFEIEAEAVVDQRELGMTWSPMGLVRAPSKLIVRGRLVRAEDGGVTRA
jgi:polyisoprenoid-binding protein YceI